MISRSYYLLFVLMLLLSCSAYSQDKASAFQKSTGDSVNQVPEKDQVIEEGELSGKVASFTSQSSTEFIVQFVIRIVFYLIGIIAIALGLENFYSKKSKKHLNKEEKKNVIDADGYLKVVGRAFIGSGIMIAVVYHIPLWWNLGWIGQAITCLAFIITIMVMAVKYMDIYSSPFKKGHKPAKNKKSRIMFSATLLSMIVLFLAGSFIWIFTISERTMNGRELTYSGAYGFTEKVMLVEMINELPEIKAAVEGFSIFNLYRGVYKAEKMGIVRLHLNSDQPPFIYLRTESGIPVIINGSSGIETKEISDQMEFALRTSGK